MRRTGIKLIGLCLLAALSLVALGAASAQAQSNTGEFEIKNKTTLAVSPLSTLSDTGTPGVEKLGGKLGAAGGKLLVPGLGLTLKCAKGKVAEGTIETKGAMSNALGKGELEKGHGKVEFEECSVEGAEEVCKVTSPIVATGFILIYRLGNIIYIVLHALLGKPFTTITISGEECAFAATNEPVSGDEVLKGVKEAEKLSVEQAVVPATSTERKSLETMLAEQKEPALAPLKYGNEPASIDGEALARLVGAHEGMEWDVK